MRKIRVIALILSLIVAVGTFAACSDNGDDNSQAASESVSTASTETSTEPISEEVSTAPVGPLDHIEDQYLDRTITFLVEHQNGGGYGSKEIMPDEESAISPFVAERNRMVENKLGIKIAERRTDNMINELRNAALSAPDFDIAMPYMTSAGPLITESLFYDLYEFSDIINFDAPYWDQNAEESLSMGNKLYMTTGDMSLLTLDVTHCMLFNKTIVESKHLENPYALVESGDWTIDKMLEMAKQVTADTDGVDGLTYKDTIGLFINNNYANSLFIGAGQSFAKKNPDGVPELTVYSEDAVNVVDKIFEVFHDDKVLAIESFNNDAISDGYTNCYWAARDRLANNGALFVTIALSDVLNMADYDCDFGMLVTPKFTKEQDTYRSYISIIYATGCVIPSGLAYEDAQVAALVLEAMNAASSGTVKSNYYDRIFKLQMTKDEESEKMLDTIFNNRVYDIGALYNWNNLRDFISNVAGYTVASNSFKSQFESSEGTFNQLMQSTIDFFNN